MTERLSVRSSIFLVSAVFLSMAVSASTPEAPAAPSTGAPAVAPTETLQPAPVFDIGNLDRSADPCVDFYQFSCGGWMKTHPVPPDRGSYGRGRELQDHNLALLKEILEKASAPAPGRTPVIQKIGDLYAACMDEKGVEAKGSTPLKADLERIAALKSKSDLAPLVARLHVEGALIPVGRGRGRPVFFEFGSQSDFKDAASMIAGADQAGLGLPDRDYYLNDDEKSRDTRKQYQEHVAKTLVLLGDSPERAAAGAAAVVKIETALARASLDKVKRREPANLDHKMSRKQLAGLAPSFDWNRYFDGIGAPRFSDLNVAVPDFFKGLEGTLKTASLDEWKDYLRWHVAGAWSPWLSGKFADQTFSFYGKSLGGAQELPPRWKRCVELVDQNLGEALGQPYVEGNFGADGKQRTLGLVQAVEKSLEKDIREIPWMSETTKPRALEKLAAITNKIGYPDHWRDYSKVTIARDDLIGDIARCREFELRRDLGKIGKPRDKSEWGMSPPTVNAYYNPQMNNINFPAGILQPPYFDARMDDAVNYGAIGMVIGHELTHGFDDQGRQFDPDGNLKDWWTPEDAKEFGKRADCIVNQYSGYTAVEDLKLNGKLTLGENVADNGGLRVAYMALAENLGNRMVDPIDGFTPQQRFFLGYGQVWCANFTDAEARLRAMTDPHSLPRYRVNGVVSNMPEFQQAFACTAGSPMVRADFCRVW